MLFSIEKRSTLVWLNSTQWRHIQSSRRIVIPLILLYIHYRQRQHHALIIYVAYGSAISMCWWNFISFPLHSLYNLLAIQIHSDSTRNWLTVHHHWRCLKFSLILIDRKLKILALNLYLMLRGISEEAGLWIHNEILGKTFSLLCSRYSMYLDDCALERRSILFLLPVEDISYSQIFSQIHQEVIYYKKYKTEAIVTW